MTKTAIPATTYSSNATVKSIVTDARNERLSIRKSLESKFFSPFAIRDLIVEAFKAFIICFCALLVLGIICYIQYRSGAELITIWLIAAVGMLLLTKKYWSTFYVGYLVTRKKK